MDLSQINTLVLWFLCLPPADEGWMSSAGAGKMSFFPPLNYFLPSHQVDKAEQTH